MIYIYFFLYTTDIFRTRMHFPRVNVTFYDAVNNIHDVIRKVNPFPYIANSRFSVLEIIKLKKSDVER